MPFSCDEYNTGYTRANCAAIRAAASAHPAAEDVLLVVEIADTTLAFDTGTKIPLYARAGIAEAWVVDLQERAARGPARRARRSRRLDESADGMWRSVDIY